MKESKKLFRRSACLLQTVRPELKHDDNVLVSLQQSTGPIECLSLPPLDIRLQKVNFLALKQVVQAGSVHLEPAGPRGCFSHNTIVAQIHSSPLQGQPPRGIGDRNIVAN